jgi:hypothetical protein
LDENQSLRLYLTDEEKIAIRNSGPGMRRLLAYTDAVAGRVDSIENRLFAIEGEMEKAKKNGRGPGRPKKGS